MSVDYYTLVQHSGYTRGRNPQFEAAVEAISVSLDQARRVSRSGGVLFASYRSADKAEYYVNYRGGELKGLIPEIRGGFTSRAKIDECPIYIPCVSEDVPGAVAYSEPVTEPHSITFEALCTCGWSYGPGLQSDVCSMDRMHQGSEARNMSPRYRRALHPVQYRARCGCGWIVKGDNQSGAVKAAQAHRKEARDRSKKEGHAR